MPLGLCKVSENSIHKQKFFANRPISTTTVWISEMCPDVRICPDVRTCPDVRMFTNKDFFGPRSGPLRELF